MDKGSRIFIAGHRGLVGSAILRHLINLGFNNLFTESRDNLDLSEEDRVFSYLALNNIEYVFLAAARVGGIGGNDSFPFDFIYENLCIQNSVINASRRVSSVKKLLFLGSSCIYPKYADYPIAESSLLSGYLETTNEAYALAKIAGLKMCEYANRQYGKNFIAAMPTNVYGINDNFDLESSHVIPALIRKFVEAQDNLSDSVIIWGSGNPLREFIYADDLARACVFLMERFDYVFGEPVFVNVGSSDEVSIKALAYLIRDLVGYQGDIIFDRSRPDGTFRKKLDLSRIGALGFRPEVSLKEGLRTTIDWYGALKKDQ